MAYHEHITEIKPIFANQQKWHDNQGISAQEMKPSAAGKNGVVFETARPDDPQLYADRFKHQMQSENSKAGE